MIKKILGHPLLILAARLFVGIVFVFFAIGKIEDPAGFARSIANYNIMPDFSINIMALILPWIELLCGLCFIAGIWLRASGILTATMLIVFITAILIAMSNGLSIDCGCSTSNAQAVGWKKVFEDTLWLAATVLIILFPSEKFTIINLKEQFCLQNTQSKTS